MKDDIFRKIWEDQAKFNKNIYNKEELDEAGLKHWNNYYTLALHREVSEALNELDWKEHREEHKKVVRSNQLEEFIDIFKYWMCLVQLHGFDLEDVIDEYFRKSTVVEQRYRQEKQLQFGPDDRIVGVDIDGVLAQYPKNFVDFINDQLGTDHDVSEVTSYDIYDDLGIPLELGLKLKDEYRQTGQKRFIPVHEGAEEFLRSLHEAGYKVVLLTARPYEKYKRIVADTMEWLDKNNLYYDALVFGENKHEILLDKYDPDQIEFFVDDVLGNAEDISRLGVKCYLMDAPYNQTDHLREGITRVYSLYDIMLKEGLFRESKVEHDG